MPVAIKLAVLNTPGRRNDPFCGNTKRHNQQDKKVAKYVSSFKSSRIPSFVNNMFSLERTILEPGSSNHQGFE